MLFDQNNKIVNLCSQGMDLEGSNPQEASKRFLQAWTEATNDFEKFIAAHYVARCQKSVAAKLEWDETALNLALKIDDDNVKGALPSLYLNIAKCHEDLHDFEKARLNYDLALSFSNLLTDNGYGTMIKRGIMNGIHRMNVSGN